MPTISVNGTNLFYKESGSGEPLVLVHGTGFNADVWDHAMPLLAKRYRVIAYDRRGYQRSEGPPASAKGYGAQQGEDLAGLIRALDLAPANVLGWSSGSFAALHAARLHPELIGRLVLYEPPLHGKKAMQLDLVGVVLKVMVLRVVGQHAAASETFLRAGVQGWAQFL